MTSKYKVRLVAEPEVEAESEDDAIAKAVVQLSKEMNRLGQEFSFQKLQEEQLEWSNENFGPDSPWQHPLMGLVEEVGELHHAILKQEQGIRGTHEEHEAAAKDAVGDIMIYLVDFCSRRGWNLGEITEETWQQVKARNWKKNPEGGSV